jgi:xanthine dehydrogenase accessory factor
MVNKETELWEFIRNSLSTGHYCVLLLVTRHTGSSPGRTGFKMAINTKGKMIGSIGGGIMEHKLVELSKKWLVKGQKAVKLKHQIHRAEANKDRSGMICSGEQYVAVTALNPESLDQVDRIISSIKQGTSELLVSSPKGITVSNESMDLSHIFQYDNEEDWLYREKLGYQPALHIIGGGHISLALSKLAVTLDFKVTVYDHRENLPTILENQYANEIRLIEYNQLNELIPSGEKNFVVVMTVGYRTDMDAIKNVIGGDYAYLGLLGSKAKIMQMMKELKEQGFGDELLYKIDAPAGLDIGSQTPMEIAVSIAGRLIQHRNPNGTREQ